MRWTFIAAAAAGALAAGCAAVTGPEPVEPAGASAAEVEAPVAVSRAAPTFTTDDGAVFTGDAMRAHMEYLSSDALEGREAGTPGYDMAAAYVRTHMADYGLKPGGVGGYLQPVKLRAFKHVESSGSVVYDDGETWDPSADIIVRASAVKEEVSVTAPVVFAGFGMVSPELGRDDYAGLDVEGKIVAILAGAPKGLQSEERAYYGSGATKGIEADKRGAVGVVTVYTPTLAKRYGFERARYGQLASKSMTWMQPNGAPYDSSPGVEAGALLSLDGGEKLFKGAPQSFESVIEMAESDAGNPPSFALPVTMTMTVKSALEDLDSANVIGMIEGSDPVLKNEYVVLTAHLDHIGNNGPEIDGDKLNNGAMDNAAGTAAMLEVARAAMASGKPMKRSVLFMSLTAEEKGLVGAQYFVSDPTVPGDKIVANVNLDMPILTYDFTDVVAFGADRSDLEGHVAEAAAAVGIALSPDPQPDQALFTRSDHYRFVQGGIPSIFLVTGWDNGGEAKQAAFFAERYHRATDEIGDHIDFGAGAKFAAVNYEIMRRVADAPTRPLWRAGDFFATRYDGPMHEAE